METNRYICIKDFTVQTYASTNILHKKGIVYAGSEKDGIMEIENERFQITSISKKDFGFHFEPIVIKKYISPIDILFPISSEDDILIKKGTIFIPNMDGRCYYPDSEEIGSNIAPFSLPASLVWTWEEHKQPVMISSEALIAGVAKWQKLKVEHNNNDEQIINNYIDWIIKRHTCDNV